LNLLATSGEAAAPKRTPTTVAKSATPTTAWTGALAAAVALRVDQCAGCAEEDSGQKNDNRLFHAVRHIHTVFDVAERASVVSNLLKGR
jgi:hypothetical protein